MLKCIGLFVVGVVCFLRSDGQLVQGTIKPGATVDAFEVWLRPDFSNSTQYLFQIGLPIAFPVSAVAQPTGVTVALDAGFVSAFGSNYTVTVNPVASATGGVEKYFNIVLIRGGAGASVAQTWTAGVEFKVLTGTFTYGSGGTAFLAKLADYQDGGSDGQGYFYSVDGNANYYMSSNSVANFYGSVGNSQVGGSASAGYAQVLSGVLPVRLIGFGGYGLGGKNVLEWRTGVEVNNRGFDVERSTNGYDYAVVGFVGSLALEGNSGDELSYKFEDNAPVGVRQYYRLRQWDLDGKSTLGAAVLIDVESPTILRLDRVFPNPAVDGLNVRLYSPKRDELRVLILDGNGRQVLWKDVVVEFGANTIGVDVSGLSRGGYLLKLVCKDGCERLVERFMKR